MVRVASGGSSSAPDSALIFSAGTQREPGTTATAICLTAFPSLMVSPPIRAAGSVAETPAGFKPRIGIQVFRGDFPSLFGIQGNHLLFLAGDRAPAQDIAEFDRFSGIGAECVSDEGFSRSIAFESQRVFPLAQGSGEDPRIHLHVGFRVENSVPGAGDADQITVPRAYFQREIACPVAGNRKFAPVFPVVVRDFVNKPRPIYAAGCGNNGVWQVDTVDKGFICDL